MKKLKVLILFGGKSGEHEVSAVSAFSVLKALDKNKYDVTMLGIDKTGRWVLPNQKNLLAEAQNPRAILLNKAAESVGFLPYQPGPGANPIVAVAPAATPTVSGLGGVDVVIPILHGTNGEDGTVQGLLELANVPYVGSGVLGSAIGMDKDVTKRLLKVEGIPVVPWQTVRREQFKTNPDVAIDAAEKAFGYPYFVKPANAGSSVGVNKVKTRAEAQDKWNDAFLYDTKILVEKGIAARELEVSVLGNESPKASIVGEIVPTHEFYSYESKYMDENGAILKIPAENLPERTIRMIQALALKAFQALELKGMARVDFFLDKTNGDIFLNEVNTIPGFTSISMYPKLWEASGLKYADLLDELIRLAIDAHEQKASLKTTYQPKK